MYCAHKCPETDLGRMKTRHSAAGGFTLAEMMFVMLILGMIAAISVPAMLKYRGTAEVKLCISNLRVLDNAKNSWAFERRRSPDAIPTPNDIRVYLQFQQMPVCPANGDYRLRRLSRKPTCTLYPLGHTLSSTLAGDDALPN